MRVKAFTAKETLIEWHTVRKEALANKKEVHQAFLFGFMVQKGVEYPDGYPERSSSTEWF